MVSMTSFQQLSDHELMHLVAEGDKAAFAALYDRYKGVLYLHAYRMLDNGDDANDILQELFTTLWLRRKELVFTGSVSAYLYQSVRNRVLDVIAHQKVTAKYIDSLNQFIETDEYSTDQQVREQELSQLIEQEVARLPAKMREIFELSRINQLSYKEIAEALNISDKTVKKQVNNALRILRQKIDLIILYFPFT
ncbi:RNA polymerase sigma-70 factor [Larkinella harenae]